MSEKPEIDEELSARPSSMRKFLLCLNGYPQASARTFDEAASLAGTITSAGEDETYSIYQIETGIHFYLPAHWTDPECCSPN
jgi:hypothetical protein